MRNAPRLAVHRATKCAVNRTAIAGGSVPLLPFAGAAATRRVLIPFIFFVAVGSLLAVLYRTGSLSLIVPFGDSYPADYPIDFSDLESDDVRLERVLKEASMEDKTVILTTLNSAWAEPGSIIDLFIESFRTGIKTRTLLNHLVIVSLDLRAYKRCMAIHTHCFALGTEGEDFSEEKSFMTLGYVNLMWRRVDFLSVVLEKGYSFIFSDADIMWFRNPLPYFYRDTDFQIACDHFVGDSTDLRNIANGGFGYVKSNNRSIEFYKFWYLSRLNYSGYHDQDVLNKIKSDPYIRDILGVTIRFLSTRYFGGICEPSRDLSKVCTMHANCCIGLDSKIHDLKIILEDWRYYLSLPTSLKGNIDYLWRVPQNCSIAALNQLIKHNDG